MLGKLRGAVADRLSGITGESVARAFTNIGGEGASHLERAIGGAAVGGALGVGTHLATGIAGAVLSPTGMTHSDLSFGGALGAGMMGAAIGGAIGGGMVKNVKKLAGGVDVDGWLNTATQGQLRPWASKAMETMGMLAPKTSTRLARKAGPDIAANLELGARLGQGFRAEEGMWGTAKKIYNQASRPGGRLGAAAAAGGIGFAAYSSNAMGLAIPGNYGYR